MQHESGSDSGIESIAAAFQHRHAGGRAEPMGAGDDTEGSLNFGSGRKHV